LAAAGVLFMAAVLIGLVSLRLAKVISDESAQARLAQAELLEGTHLLQVGASGLTAEQAATARHDFKSASQHFLHVEAVVRSDLLFRAAGRLPFAGTQVHAAIDLSDMGAHMSNVGQIAVEALSAPGTQAGDKTDAEPTQKALAVLHELDPKLALITSELAIVARDRSRIPSTGLLPQLAKVVRELDAKVNIRALQDGVVALHRESPAIQRLLGSDGAKTYLVLQQDPAELRATGGFIGSVGFLSFDRGNMAPFAPVDVYSIDADALGRSVLGGPGTPNHVDMPKPLAQVFPIPSWTLRDSNWSPDFPTAARQAEFLLQREDGRRVDGVIAIDPFLIQRLLRVVGPVLVPETGDVVDQTNFYATTLNNVEGPQGYKGKSFLAQGAKAIMAQVFSAGPGKWPDLLQVLGWGCQSRSLQIYLHDAAAQRFADDHGCGGQVRPTPGDSLMVVDSNLGATKDDFWMKRSFTLQLELAPDGTVRHTLRIRYYDLTDHGRLTEWVPYLGWLRVYLPSTASVVSINGAKLDIATDLGQRVVEGWVRVPFSTTTDVTIVYNLGASVIDTKSHRLTLHWQKQAGRPVDKITVSFGVPAGWKVEAIHVAGDPARTGTVASDLAVDRDFAFDYRP
jgi:hypothetical protein